MSSKPTSTRKWSAIIAIIAICLGIGYAIGYVIGKFLL